MRPADLVLFRGASLLEKRFGLVNNSCAVVAIRRIVTFTRRRPTLWASRSKALVTESLKWCVFRKGKGRKMNHTLEYAVLFLSRFCSVVIGRVCSKRTLQCISAAFLQEISRFSLFCWKPCNFQIALFQKEPSYVTF